jgi:hypothetical protein
LPRLAAGDARHVALAEDEGGCHPRGASVASVGSGPQAARTEADGADLFVVGCGGGRRRRPGDARPPEPTLGRGRPRHAELDGARAERRRCRPRCSSTRAACCSRQTPSAPRTRSRATVEYVTTRQQFGQPLAQFQAVKHQLANMALEVDPTRALWWYAAHAFDHAPAGASRAAALAKAHITERAQQVVRDAVEAHGGIGFTWECDVQIWFKRVMFDRSGSARPSCTASASSLRDGEMNPQFGEVRAAAARCARSARSPLRAQASSTEGRRSPGGSARSRPLLHRTVPQAYGGAGAEPTRWRTW